MKSEAKVRRKLKQVMFRHLKKRLQTTLRKRPENCLYNRQPSTHPKLKPVTGLPRVCIHAEQAGAICDISHPNSADYKGCPFFTPAESEAQVRKAFIELAKSPRDRVAEHMPDAAALMWVLDQEDGVPQGEAESATNGDEGDGEDEDEEPAPVPASDSALEPLVTGPLLGEKPHQRWWHHHWWPWNWRRSRAVTE
tara:strand:+ start:11820 stop:12404 length:585 start_codon:yes stop_codon:yes gene_type:complete